MPNYYEVEIRKIKCRNVRLKSAFVERLGAKSAQKVLDSTKPGITRELVAKHLEEAVKAKDKGNALEVA